MGSAAADGKVWKADQQSAFTDDTTTPIVCLLRTGAIGPRRRKTKIERIVAEFGVIDAAAEASVMISVYQGGKQSSVSQPVASYSANLSRKSALGEDGPLADQENNEDFVISEGVPDYTSRVLPQPQIEFMYSGQSAFEIRSYEADFTSEES